MDASRNSLPVNKNVPVHVCVPVPGLTQLNRYINMGEVVRKGRS